MHIWRVNLHTRELAIQPVPPAWERLGGRGLSARILLDEVAPTCDPLGASNKLVFAPGLLVGHMLSSCDRISIGAKSPLTGGIKEANAGGSTGLKLAHMGIKALILEGAPEGPGEWVLTLSMDGARFEPAGDLAGLGVYAAASKLLERYGPKVGIALIGPAGERLYHAAGIQNLDKDRTPSRIAARGGLGAVMGSKKLKAIVFDASGGAKPPLADPEAFRKAQKTYTQALMEHPQTQSYADFGTNAMPSLSNGLGGMPTRNLTAGQFEGVESINGERMRELLLARGGEAETTHACMQGCTIRCSNVYAGADGKTIVSPLEYETVGLMGSNLGIAELDAIARMNYVANDLGLDSIEVGAALGVAIAAGKMNFGEGDRGLELCEEIRQGTPLGAALGNGAAAAGRFLGVERVPVVKNQAMSAYDPRAIKGTGVTYATSPQGADHTAGLTIRAKVNHLDPTIQVELSRKTQINNAGYDTLGVCLFGAFGYATVPHTIKDLLAARYGWQVEEDILQVLGRETLQAERQFNLRAGLGAKDDRLPAWMKVEALPPLNSVFDVRDEELDRLFDWFTP
ncbi:MAG: aldehyde ferredoxin oxidoreductase C-terminal domain-containing protein [Anaerolineales bacterium]|nr:aldehyde ferredoxin oxidoreductase C-terminal domain-containing protein [Anaerolineales bacterium]